ncbi:beta-glucosidase [Sporobolomyces salmoneus]|uniref:beta-glucosidase n=1 Tax=Sporobolomyces salmoneus TaxID=183962 RepID=UPI003180CD09
MILSLPIALALLATVNATPVSLASDPSSFATSSSKSDSNNGTFYRSSTGGFVGKQWKEGIARAQATVAKMTLDEKLAFLNLDPTPVCSGNTVPIPRLDIPSICFSDSPQGVLSRYSSQFPSAVTRSATWDRDEIKSIAVAMGKEFHDVGINTPLAVVVGPMGRSVFGGRNWEGFGPDPFFAGEAVRETVAGMQSQGVGSNLKHFYGNEQEFLREGNPQGSYLTVEEDYIISSDIDDTTAHELYIYPFAEAVREGAASVMCAYNKLNGTLACEDDYSIKHTLKEELGFQGYVLSDWGAAFNEIPAALSGLDFVEGGQLPKNAIWANLGTAVANGSVPLANIEDKIVRVLTPYYALNQASLPTPDFSRSVVSEKHNELIRNVSAHGITLLKNNKTRDSTFGLPIQEKGLRDIILVGDSATYGPYGIVSNSVPSILYFNPDQSNFEGQITGGFGSGGVYAPYTVTPVEAFTARGRKASPPIFVDGYYDNNATAGSEDIGLGRQYLLDSRLGYAGKVVVFVSAVAMESADRTTLELAYGGADLVNYVADRFNDTVVVVSAPGPVNLTSFVDHPNVTSLVYAYFPGHEAGNSIADALFGDVNPSGKLPFTIGKNLEDYDLNAIYNDSRVPFVKENFTEGVFIDYKYFDQQNTTPLYEYGYGLSYTTFNMSKLSIKSTSKAGRAAVSETNEKFFKDGKNETCKGLYDISHTVTAVVKNTGKVAGAEVAQLYLTYPDSTPNKMPIRNLRGFEKPFLQPGESKTVTFELRNKDLSVWDAKKQGWMLPQGEFKISVGNSSRKLPLKGSFTV